MSKKRAISPTATFSIRVPTEARNRYLNLNPVQKKEVTTELGKYFIELVDDDNY